jgi:hypothetical protein
MTAYKYRIFFIKFLPVFNPSFITLKYHQLASSQKNHQINNGCHAGREWIQGDIEQKRLAGL